MGLARGGHGLRPHPSRLVRPQLDKHEGSCLAKVRCPIAEPSAWERWRRTLRGGRYPFVLSSENPGTGVSYDTPFVVLGRDLPHVVPPGV